MDFKTIKQKKILIIITGVPGTGKSTTASYLSQHFDGVPIVSTDIIRAFVISNQINDSVWLNNTSHQAWKEFGVKTEQTITEGFIKHSIAVFDYTYPLVDQLFKTYSLVILEGVHICQKILDECQQRYDLVIPIYIPIDSNNHIAWLEHKMKMRISQKNNWIDNYDILETLDRYFLTIFNHSKNTIRKKASYDILKVLHHIKDRIGAMVIV